MPVQTLAALDPIGLDEVTALAELHQRHDAKFLLGVGEVDRLVAELSPRVRVLEVHDERLIRYDTVYFDSPDLTTYRWHVQRRRRRYKVRTRHYGEATATVLELKLKATLGQTVKRRWPHPEPTPDTFGAASRALVDHELEAAYGQRLFDEVGPVARTRFVRSTLVDTVLGERITIDRYLVADVQGHEVSFDPDLAIVECKTSSIHAPLLHTMVRLGHRPVRVSKYGLGVVAAQRHAPGGVSSLRGNDWLPALHQLRPAT